MDDWLISDLKEWAKHEADQLQETNFSPINVIEALLRSPGRSTRFGGHRILYWPKNRRLGRMSRAMAQVVPPANQACLVVKFGEILDPETGQLFTPKDFIYCSSLRSSPDPLSEFNRRVRDSVRELRIYFKKKDARS